MKDIIVPIVVALIAGGGITMLGNLYQARIRARAADERMPAEVEGLFLGNAEKALGILQNALDRAEGQIGRLESALERERQQTVVKDQRIADLELQLAQMRAQVNELQRQCDRLGIRISELRDDDEPGVERG